jgi:hypothetical protein
MGQLNMKNFAKSSGGDSPNEVIDFKSLEENSNFKASQEGVEAPVVQEGAQAPENNIPEGTEGVEAPVVQEGAEAPEGVKAKPEGAEAPEGSSLKEPNKPVEPTPQVKVPDVTDEMILKSLSEKLGREITSYDDLPQKALELDPQVKAINEWKEKTGRPLEDFFKFQKDYSEVSDVDVARESLRIEYPTLTPDEINLEMERFISTEDDLDSETAKKNLELKKYATQGRKVLETLKVDLGQPSTGDYPTEVKTKLEFAEQIQKQIDANKSQQTEYAQGITSAADSYEAMKLKLSDDLVLDFKVSDTDKKAIPNLINEMPHWRKEDGSWNHQAVVEDAVKIKHFDAMIKLAYEQGLNSGKDTILKDAKNSTLGNVPAGTEQGTGTKKPIIEGIDKMLERHQGQRIRFGKK